MRSSGARDERTVVADAYLGPLRTYERTVLALFPRVGKQDLEALAAPAADTLFLGHFLERLPGSVVALQVGATVGDSAYCLASHPGVSRVVSVNLNLPAAGPEGPGMLAVARAAFEEHPEEREKTVFVEALGETERAIGATPPDVALIDGLSGRDEARDALGAVFALNPRAVALVGDRGRGPFVRAGVADFLDGAGEDLRFRAVRDLGPALAGSALDALYAADAIETEKALEGAGHAFSEKLDLLRLLQREEELTNTVSGLDRRLSEAEERGSNLEGKLSGLRERLAESEARSDELRTRLSGRRYRLADAVVERALRVPAVKRLLARGDAPPDRPKSGE